MTIQAPAWFRTEYEDRVMHIYQTRGNRLRTTVTIATSFTDAGEAKFFLAGKTVARKIDRTTTPVPGGGDRKTFIMPLSTWQAFDEITDYDMDRTKPAENEVVYESGAMALGRATDKEIYDIGYAAAPAVAAGFDFSAGAFTAAQAMALARDIRQQTKGLAADGEIYCGLPSDAFDQLLANKIVYNSHPVGEGFRDFLVPTESRYWRGVHWFELIEEDAGDFFPIPSANKCDALIWHRSALGWGNKEDLSMIPQWDNRMQGGGGWTFNMKAKGGCGTLQEGRGIRRFRLSTNSDVVIN